MLFAKLDHQITRRGAAPPKQKFRPSQTAQHAPPKLPLPLRHFQDGGFFLLEINREPEEN